MENRSNVLGAEVLRKLEEQKQIIYFNYIGDYVDLSKIPEEKIRFLLKGDSHTIVNGNLYVKIGDWHKEYALVEKDFKWAYQKYIL